MIAGKGACGWGKWFQEKFVFKVEEMTIVFHNTTDTVEN